MSSGLSNILQTEQSQRILYLTLVLFAFAVIFALSLFPLEDVDTWMHLKYGEYIVNTKSIPQEEFFSYTVTGTKDVDHEWLAQIVLYLVYRLVGFDGLVLFKTFIILLTFGILLKTAHFLWGRSYLSVMVLLGMALTSAFRFVERPGLFTIFLLAVLIYILFTYQRSKSQRRIYFLPLIFLLWVNMHGGFIIGWGFLALYTGAQLLFYFLKSRIKWFDNFSLSKERIKFLIIFSFLSVVICLVNPYGLEMVILPFRGLFTLSRFFAELNEWKSPFDPIHQPREYTTLFVVTGALSLVLFLLNFRKFHPLYFLLFLFFVGASFSGMRNISLYALGIYVPLVYNLKEFFASFKATDFQKRVLAPFIKIGGLALVFLLFLQFVYRGNQFGLNYHFYGTGVRESYFPIKAVDFVDRVNIEGNLLNQYSTGSYLIWRSYPKRRVFIDGRSGLYGEDFFFRYKSFAFNEDEFKKATEEFDFNYILVIDSGFLQDNPDWKLAYFDNVFRVYLKNIERNQEVIEQYGYNFLDPSKNLKEIFAKFSDETAPEYKKEILRSLAQNYQTTVTQVILAEFYQKTGAPDKSLQQLKTAVETGPDLAHTYLALGNYYAQAKFYDEAIENYDKVIDLDSQMAQPHHNKGNIYLNQGEYKRAVKEYQKALFLDDQYALSYLGLGVIFSEYLNNPAKAIAAYQNYLALAPDSEQKSAIENKIGELQNHL